MIFSKITQIYEHQPGDSERLTYLIVDCETYSRLFTKRCMSVDEIDEVLLRFPKWFYEQLCARRFILPDEAVTFVLKRKSRALGEDDFKVSYHFIVEIAGTPLWHRAVCAEIFQPYAADIRSIQTTKSLDHLLDDQIRQPMFYVDVATLHGHQGFATYFSRKKTTDPYPLLLRRMAFKNGKLVAERHFAPPPHEPSEPTALQHLLNASYTVPKIYVANYADSVAVMVRHFLFCLLIGTRGIEPHGYHFLFVASRRSQKECRRAAQPRRAHRTPPFARTADAVAAALPLTCRPGLSGCWRSMGVSLGVCGTMTLPSWIDTGTL